MRLKRLELFGFKSFADRTVLTFDRVLTGVVGPNGCGKSNVVDAVRWVLGETRPTSMRGGEMADVVFKGSVSRPAMSVAEATMVIGNEDGELPGRGSEVSITRRVYTSGEGEYLIDGERVRLKDLRDMLFDTGLGSRGYAVLEQGRIDAVLSANPLDRRAIFEEAAGISRYRQRRKETESRLKRVEQDVLRLDDVLRELGTRVRSLKIQAGKAERFLAARDEWRTQRARYARHRLAAERDQLEVLAGELAVLERRTSELRTLREGEEGDAEQREREQRSLASQVDRQAGEVARLAAEARACDERCAHLAGRVEAGRRAAQDESQRALELAATLELREADLERIGADAQAREQSLAAVDERLAGEQRGLETARGRLSELRRRSEEAGQQALRLLGERTEAQNTVRHLEAARAPLSERASRLDQRLEHSRESVAELRARNAESEARLESAEQALQEAGDGCAAYVAELGTLSARAEQASAQRSALELENARLSSRIDALRDWEREREGLEAGARALLAAVERGEAPLAPAQLRGLVADHLRTSTRLARALDSALGAGALALVVEDTEQAARVADWLAERKGGLVRLTTPRGLAPALLGHGEWRDELQGDQLAAVEGLLLDEILVDPGFEPLARWLVGDVLVVRDRESALALVARHPRWRCVTPDGQLVDALGLVGGHREIAQGAVGRRASAAELDADLERGRKAQERLDAELSELGQRRVQLEEELERAREVYEERRQAHAEARGEGQTARARLADLEQSLSLAERERAHLDEEVCDLEGGLAEARERLARSSAGHGTRSEELDALEAECSQAEAELNVLQEGLAATRSEAARARAELEGLRHRASDLERVCRESSSELERARRLSREHAQSADDAAAEAVGVRAEGDRNLVARGEAERRLDELRCHEREGREAMEVFRQRADAVTRELEELSARVSELRLESQRIDLERSELAGRVQEELGLDETALLADFQPEAELAADGALDELAESVSELRRRLDAVGPVNTEAVAELEEASRRFDFLDGQRKDLARSKQSLDEALATINEESLRLFTATFDEVRGHFLTLFRQLFGGGKADLALGTDGDPLECGIEITARPPGREMLPIGLLSGGQRSMTALALLFAVFRARPSPFCVLDEVDAALDDANVGRFLAMLDTFLSHTQFLIVTHNKGTMAACDSLYGITMETKGVSTHVAVEFGDVDRFVPEATGDAVKAASARAEVADGNGAVAAEKQGPAESDRPAERVVVLQPQPPPQTSEPVRTDDQVEAAAVSESG